MVSKTTGTVMGASATLPATYDGAGYGAVGYTTLGEAVDVSEIGKVWSMITHEPMNQLYPTKIKDAYDIPDINITIGRDSTDAGQILLAAAVASTNAYSFKVTLPSGDTLQFTGFVIKAGLGPVARSGVETTVVTVSIVPESLYEA